MEKINVSIVLYNSNIEKTNRTIMSIVNDWQDAQILLIDNSPTDILIKDLHSGPNIEYVWIGANLGFGKGNNYAMRHFESETKYSLIINPDVYFENGVIGKLIEYMETNPQIGLIGPKVLYPNGELQYTCKLLPKPTDMFIRFFLRGSEAERKLNYEYEMRFFDHMSVREVPSLSGCFMFFRTTAFWSIGGFDERFFLHFEDIDVTRRMYTSGGYISLFYPNVTIRHHFEKGTYKNLRVFWETVKSYFKYHHKYGFFDREREQINNRVMQRNN